jgi:NAD(P)H-dependent FMN reductase
MKYSIPIILGSTRRGRQSERVARYVLGKLAARANVDTSLIDLLELELPVMEERLRFLADPPPRLVEFGKRIDSADALLIVTPEYNHGYPGVLKNALDYLLPEYHRKPVGIVTVSAGAFGGLHALTALRQSLFGMGALPLPAALPVARVQDAFSEEGALLDRAYERRVAKFLDELVWFTEAIAAQKSRSPLKRGA